MEGGRSRRPLVIGLVIVAVVAGVLLAILLTGGDDGDEKTSARATSETTATTESTGTQPTETSTTTDTAPGHKQDERGIERAVTTFVELAEQSDPAACSQVAGGEGMQLEQCAGKVGIDLRTLPSSDELDIRAVAVSGDRATVRLSNGATFTLGKTAGRWKITGYRPFR